MNMLRAAFLSSALLSLGGCLSGVLPKASEQAQYTLPDAVAQRDERPMPLALLVDVPRAVAPLDGVDVVVIRADGEVQIMTGARWTAPLPILLQDLLVRTIEAAGLVPAVAQSAQTHRLPLRLSGELRAFELHDDGAGLSARAALNLRLICSRNAEVLASSGLITVEAADLAAGVAGAVASLRDLALKLSQQTLQWLQQADVSSCAES